MAQDAIGKSGAPAAGAQAPSSSSPTGKRRMTYTEFLDVSPMSKFLWLVFWGVALAQILDGIDFMSTSFALPLVLKEFKITAAQAGAIGSFTNVGLLFGALIFSPLSDRYGRKTIFQWVLFTYAFGTFLSAIAPNYQFLLFARFIAGLGIGAEFPVAFALLAEYSPKRLRHILVAFGPAFYSFGWFVCAILSTWVIPRFGWRAIYWLGVSPALMIIYIRRYMPESVRFLLQRGRIKEAGEITRKLADAAGFTDVELVPPEMTAPQHGPGFLSQLSSLRAFALTVVVVGCYFWSFHIQNVGFGTWLPSIFIRQGFTVIKSFKFTMIVLTVTPIGQLGTMWLQDRMPRKWALLLLSGLATLCFFAFGLSFEMKYPIGVVIAFNVGYQFFSAGVPVILYTLGAELFPTRVRSLGMGLVTAFGRVGAIVGPYVIGLFLTFGTAIHQIIYYFVVPLFLTAIVAMFYLRVDTRQKTLEQVTGE